ncbi:MAG: hypothetical protein ACRDQH_04040 [Pseudonocardiaceae bacterium]
MSPSYSLIEVSPCLAEEMLGKNRHNRNLRSRVVTAYALDMQAGKWAENGESIKIAKDGTLLDGQHRLSAIVESGTTQPMLVIQDLSLSAQDTVDTGLRRGFADVLKLRKEPNWVDVASVTRRVYLYKRGARRGSGNEQPSVPQMLATLEAHPEIRYSAEVAIRVARRLPVQKSVVGLCHWLFGRVETVDSPNDCEHFFELLADGSDLSRNHPVFVLRRTIIDTSLAKSSRVSINETVLTVYIIKAWNAYRDGKDISILRWRVGGANPEVFPEPK